MASMITTVLLHPHIRYFHEDPIVLMKIIEDVDFLVTVLVVLSGI